MHTTCSRDSASRFSIAIQAFMNSGPINPALLNVGCDEPRGFLTSKFIDHDPDHDFVNMCDWTVLKNTSKFITPEMTLFFNGNRRRSKQSCFDSRCNQR